MKICSQILAIVALIALMPYAIYAQDLSTVVGDSSNSNEELDQKEEEREADFLNQLLLDIPTLTDNPSHIITFVDPSEEKNGVQIEIDGKNFQDVTSPYTLPALGIGQHELRFKFVDKYGSTQIIEESIIIVPRPPIINSPVFGENDLILSGTGLSNSSLILITSSGKKIITKESDISGEGDWEIRIGTEELIEGIYTITGYTRKYGFASNLSEAITFEIGGSDGIVLSNTKDIYFKFKDISIDEVPSIISSNPDLLVIVGSSLVLGFVLNFILNLLFKDRTDEKKVKILENKISKNGKENKEMTLKEKLSLEKKDEKKEKEEKIVTKIDFLKDFKMHDPDDSKGKEKENIKVTLTSKE